MSLKKRKQREQELQAALYDEQELKRSLARPLSDFYVIDDAKTTSSKILERRAKRVRRRLRETTTGGESKTDAVLVERMMGKLERRREQESKASTKASAEKKTTTKKKRDDDDDSFVEKNGAWLEEASKTDLWAGDEDLPAPKLSPARVALPGQSYNPAIEDHQAVVATAVAVETRRSEKAEADKSWWTDRKAKLSKQIQEETIAAAGKNKKEDDEDESDENESDDDDDDAAQSVGAEAQFSSRLTTRDGKTRAERNKMKRRRVLESELSKKKDLKSQRAALTDVKKIRKELDKRERDLAARRTERATKAPADVLPHTAPAVALSDDLLQSDGTLRKSSALQAPAHLIRGFADATAVARHLPLKKRKVIIERKKPPKRKFRGAKIISKYRKPWQQD